MRGFDYYTGMVFEVFDTSPDNNRSIFGGGRYDDLMDIFGAKKIPAVGFGAGDVTAKDFLETHALLPKYVPPTDVYIATLGPEFLEPANNLAQNLRENGLSVALDLTEKKLGDQIKVASKQGVPFLICVGENEVTSGVFAVKNMGTGEEVKVKAEEIAQILLNR